MLHILRHLLRPRLIMRLRLVVLRLMLRLIVLRLVLLWLMLIVLRLMVLIVLRLLMVLLLARIEVLLLARRERFADLRLIVAVVVAIVGRIVVYPATGLLLLVIGIALAKLFLSGCDQAEIMFGGNPISGALRVAGELQIFFGDVRRRSTNFYVLPVGLVHS